MDSLELSCSNKTLVEPELACNMWEKKVRLFFLLFPFYFISFRLECIAVVCSCPSHHHPSSCFWLLSRVCEHFHLQSTHSALNKISARIGGEADRLSPLRAGSKAQVQTAPSHPCLQGRERRGKEGKEFPAAYDYYCHFSTTRATRRQQQHSHSTTSWEGQHHLLYNNHPSPFALYTEQLLSPTASRLRLIMYVSRQSLPPPSPFTRESLKNTRETNSQPATPKTLSRLPD